MALLAERSFEQIGLAEVAALRLGDILGLGATSAKLDGSVAVLVCFATRDDLQPIQLKNGNRHVPTIVLEQAGHPHLLRDHASAHDLRSLTEAPPGPSRRCL